LGSGGPTRLVQNIEVGKRFLGFRQVVDLVARLLAPAAADAERRVMQYALAFGVSLEGPSGGGSRARTRERGTKAQTSHKGKERSSVHMSPYLLLLKRGMTSSAVCSGRLRDLHPIMAGHA